MMWISFLLMMFFGTATYREQVDALHERGCHVYNDYWISCPDVERLPPSAVPIPADAVEIL